MEDINHVIDLFLEKGPRREWETSVSIDLVTFFSLAVTAKFRQLWFIFQRNKLVVNCFRCYLYF